MRTLRTAVAVSLLALALAAAPARAITGNYLDDFVHGYVGLLVFYTDDQPVSPTHDPFSHRCSGSLLTPRVVLTAGHCTQGVRFGRIYMAQSVAPNFDPQAFFGFGGDPSTGYPFENGVTFSHTFNYGFDAFQGFPDTHDVGIVILDEPVTLPEYGVLAVPGSLDPFDRIQHKQDVLFTSSGYGLSYEDPVHAISFRKRLMAFGSLVNLHNSLTDGFNLETTSNPGNDRGGTCSGDSGGPVFFGGLDFRPHRIVSVTSFGLNANCRGLDFSYRIDRQAVLDFIREAVGPAEFAKIQIAALP